MAVCGTLLDAPQVVIRWTATALGTSFGGYNIYRRPSRAPIVPWSRIGAITVPTGFTAATVEAQHIAFVDYEAGWGYTGGQWATGWDYAISSVNGLTGIETPITIPDVSAVVVPPNQNDVWAVSNATPLLNFPINVLADISNQDSQNVMVIDQAAGRDLAVTRTKLELPYRTFAYGWSDVKAEGLDSYRTWRAAQALGATMCVHAFYGDRVIGTLLPFDNARYRPRSTSGIIEYGGKLVETTRDGNYTYGDYNLPAGIVLNGSSQYLSTADSAYLRPGTSPFTIVMCAAFARTGAGQYAMAKGNLGIGQGYGLRTTGAPNALEFFVSGAGASGSCGIADNLWFDGNAHVAVATSSGTQQNLYRDGSLTPNATANIAHGVITNTFALTAGANNAGASGFMGLSPVMGYAYYPRALTALEAQAAAYYLLGYPGYRMPSGAYLFIDMRDSRCWTGVESTLIDQSGYGLTSTVVASPSTRGIPSRVLQLIDRFG